MHGGILGVLHYCPHLLTQIREARNSRTLQLIETRFRKFDLVICDEMGYVSFDKEGAEMLFNHISMRAGVRSTVITTNLPFTRWEEIIKDKVLCSALVDRLCHKAFLLNMTGLFQSKGDSKALKIINFIIVDPNSLQSVAFFHVPMQKISSSNPIYYSPHCKVKKSYGEFFSSFHCSYHHVSNNTQYKPISASI